MFKIGDRVKVTKGVSACSWVCVGKIRTIISINHRDRYCGLDCGHGGAWNKELTLYKNKPINEIEFLDAFQDNFKEGY